MRRLPPGEPCVGAPPARCGGRRLNHSRPLSWLQEGEHTALPYLGLKRYYLMSFNGLGKNEHGFRYYYLAHLIALAFILAGIHPVPHAIYPLRSPRIIL